MAERVAFATEDIGRVFIACDGCGRVMPHYRVYGRVVKKPTDGLCACGSAMFRPRRLPEWRAMWWVLVVGYLWRNLIRRELEWDPRMPVRHE